jgi:hypothetical protein
MLKKLVSIVLASLLVQVACARTVVANTGAEKEARAIEKLKAGLAKLGTGKEARVEVKLKDKTKLKGYLSEVADDHFVVIDAKSGEATKVLYPQVGQVKGNNLSKGTKQIIIIVAALAFLFVVIPLSIR